MLDQFTTYSGLLLTWLTILTLAGGIIAGVSKLNRRRIEHALKDVQDRLEDTERNLKVAVRSARVVRLFARRLYDAMLKAQMNPPEPPPEFYDD